ncbi:MAG: FHA domain-containing protein [Methanobacteriota archaeon]
MLQTLALDLSALANPQRLRLLGLLTLPRYGEELAEALAMSRQSALKHIARLEERGFVQALHGRRVTGPVVEYQVVPQRLFALSVAIADLGKLEPQGGPQIRQMERTMPSADPGGDDAAGTVSATASAPTDGEGRGHLLHLDGPSAGLRFPLSGAGPRWTIGRERDRALCLSHDPFVSGRHAEIQASRDGLDLVDALSSNGTYVNFARLPRGGRVPVKVGDLIVVGRTHLVFQKD